MFESVMKRIFLERLLLDGIPSLLFLCASREMWPELLGEQGGSPLLDKVYITGVFIACNIVTDLLLLPVDCLFGTAMCCPERVAWHCCWDRLTSRYFCKASC